ncbi:nuclease-related domain-containing protein [Haloferula sp. A504]|uniref:nuclease-related domain-containing protein n=1 Tax=Haloferula sp. A504 TaxID=3373601 RepID=UPI0031C2AD42|nr:NERD domain-containing protein [Verrucomicrobiaceae bacterium E54]
MLTALVAVLVGTKRMLSAERAKSRSPFTEKMLRPPGESLRLRLDDLRLDLIEAMMAAGIFGLAPGVVAMPMDLSRIGVLVGWVVPTAASYAAAAFYWRKVRRLRESVRNCRLGFEGERYMGAELNRLMSQGYRVFHDFLIDWDPGEASNRNIDHVVVGPAGVFAIETKARRKSLTLDDGKNAYRVEFTGEALQFPEGDDCKMLRQAARNAADLSKWLTGSASRKVVVTPVLVLPGWFVERRGQGEVFVWSGKEVVPNLPGVRGREGLNAEQIQQIGDRIEAHCRNVDL